MWGALHWYARPDFYHAVGFAFDPPCGGFDNDFSEDELVKIYGYNYPKPGKLARWAIDLLCKEYGDLIMIGEVVLDNDNGLPEPKHLVS